MKDIELPWKVIVGEGAIDKTRETVRELGLKGNALVIADDNTVKVAGNQIASELDANILIISGPVEQEVEKNNRK